MIPDWMKIVIVTPAAPKSLSGNRHTAVRWARFLVEAGHEVDVQEVWNDEAPDLMIALHARRSHRSISAFARSYPERPLVVVLTGTDLYRDLDYDEDARESLDLATHLVVLQEAALNELAELHRRKTRVIYQSAEPAEAVQPAEGVFEVCVVGNLRRVKDPFRTALASELLPPESRVRVLHAGKARDEHYEAEALAHTASNSRYQWFGEITHEEVRCLISRCRLLVQSSLMEGGANSVCEALAAGTPVISSDIPGNAGMLGGDYPGYYPAGDTRALAALLQKAEYDKNFYSSLLAACDKRLHLVKPESERKELVRMVTEATP
jgi:putative glycosyltransferase (TIGR04348 family)